MGMKIRMIMRMVLVNHSIWLKLIKRLIIRSIINFIWDNQDKIFSYVGDTEPDIVVCLIGFLVVVNYCIALYYVTDSIMNGIVGAEKKDDHINL